MTLDRAFGELRYGVTFVKRDFPGADLQRGSPHRWTNHWLATALATCEQGHAGFRTSKTSCSGVRRLLENAS